MELERILGTDKGKEAFYKTDRNFQKIINEQNTIETQTIPKSYNSTHDIPSTAKRGKLDVGLKGMSAVNLVKNGNFANGTTGWVKRYSAGVMTVTDGILNFKSTDIQDGVQQTLTTISGNKYYFKAYIKGRTSVHMGLSNEDMGVLSTDWQNLSNITTASSTSTILYIRDSVVNSNFFVDNMFCVDLTATFGSGNEPTLEQCDLIYANYIDGLQGVSNIEVLSTGKNLFDGKVELGKLNYSTGVAESDNNFWRVKNYILIEPNTNYILSNLELTSINYVFYDINKNYISSTSNTVAITTPLTAKYLKVYALQSSIGINNANLMQLEKGNIATPYEPHKSTQNIYKTLDGQPITLHRLQNGVCDEILEDGRYVKRTNYVILNGDEAWEQIYTNTDNYRASIVNFIPDNKVRLTVNNYSEGAIVNNELSGFEQVIIGINDKAYRIQFNNTDYSLYITLPIDIVNTMTGVTTLDKFKDYLNKYPVALLYELEQLQILDTNATPLIAEPNGHVFVSADGCMPANEISYPLNLGAVVDGLIDGQKEHSSLLDERGQQIDNLSSQLDLSSSLLNGWAVYSSSYPFVLVKTGRNVTLNALIKGGTLTAGTIIALINDEKFKPRNNLQFGALSKEGKVGICIITSNGEIRVQNQAWELSSEYTIIVSYSTS